MESLQEDDDNKSDYDILSILANRVSPLKREVILAPFSPVVPERSIRGDSSQAYHLHRILCPPDEDVPRFCGGMWGVGAASGRHRRRFE